MLTQEQETFLAAFADSEIEKIRVENERIRLAEEARIKKEEVDNLIEQIRIRKEQEKQDEINALINLGT